MLRISGETCFAKLRIQSTDLTCKAENFVDGADSMLQKSWPDHRPGKPTKKGLKRGNMWLSRVGISDVYDQMCMWYGRNRFKTVQTSRTMLAYVQ